MGKIDEKKGREDLTLRNGNYEYIQMLNRGNYGDIFLIKDRTGRQNFILKAYIIENKEEEIARLEGESKVINSLNHVNVAQVLDIFSENGEFREFFMITEFFPASSLRNLVNTYKLVGKKFSENIVFEWAMQIFDALVHIHRRGIIHGDLNMENVFIDENRIKIGTIGLAKTHGFYKRTSTVLTDYAYIAPEVAQKLDFCSNSDVWSAACIIYELTTLEKAFKGLVEIDTFKSILNDKLPEVENTLFIGPLLSRLFQRNPQSRPNSELVYNLLKEMNEKKSSIEKTLIEFNFSVVQKFKDGRFVNKKKLGSLSPNYNIVIDMHNDNYEKCVIRTALDVKDSELEKLNTELQTLEQLKARNTGGSRYLINFIDYFKSGSYFCLQLEYCENGSLSKTIDYLKREGKRFDIEQTRKIIIELMSALSFLHESGIVHRNLRPRVICWDRAYQLKITDYTTSTRVLGSGDKSSTASNNSMLSKDPQINYKAPELISVGEISEPNMRDKIDVWSAGCVIYETISLKKAFDGQNFIEIDNNIKMTDPELDVSKLVSKNTLEQWDKVRDLVKKMLDKNPANRPSTSKVREEMKHQRPTRW